MSRGQMAVRKVASGPSTAGSGSRGSAGRGPPPSLPSFTPGPPRGGSAMKAARPCLSREPVSTYCWARFSSGCKQGYFSSKQDTLPQKGSCQGQTTYGQVRIPILLSQCLWGEMRLRPVTLVPSAQEGARWNRSWMNRLWHPPG